MVHRFDGWLPMLFLTAALTIGGSCAKSSESKSTGDQLRSSTETTAQQGASAPAPASFKSTFTGKIDGRYDIQMELEREGDKLKGSYFYNKTGAISAATKYITLNGTIDRDGNVTLSETVFDNEKGAEVKSGEFKGKLYAVTNSGVQLLRFVGNWTRAKDNKSMSFSVEEQRPDFGADLKLVDKKHTEDNKNLPYDVKARFPQLEGNDPTRIEKFNKAVNAFVSREIGEFKKVVDKEPRAAKQNDLSAGAGKPKNTLDIDHSVTASGKDFISVLFTYYTYTGGAHPNTTTSSFNYDLNRGELIKLGGLFKPGTNYLKIISDYSVVELKKLKIGDEDWINRGAGPKMENFRSWNITPQGLMITFDAYQVASYAEGPQEVVIPYSVLKSVINPEGLLAQFVK
jgi:Protein of unknown function (DUF3298)/Deacetylase PdaC